MINLPEVLLDEIETPSLIIDIQKTERNLEKMQLICDNNKIKLRPHIKTHKMVSMALRQIELGACGISCAKLGEAEIMAEGGVEDIFVAYPIVTKARFEKAYRLSKKIKRLILSVDSYQQAKLLSNYAQQKDVVFEVRLEIDTGAHRCGVEETEIVDIAKKIVKLSNIKLTGIYTFKSLIHQEEITTSSRLAAKEEAEKMITVANQLKEIGISPLEISVGSTPTVKELLNYDIDEVRPGTYIFNDVMLVSEGVCTKDDIAACICVSIVSIKKDGTLIIDGGCKSISTDIDLHKEPYYYNANAICNNNLILSKMNEEHGYLTPKNNKKKYNIGDKLLLYPLHICTTINLYNYGYIYNGVNLLKEKVDARGKVV